MKKKLFLLVTMLCILAVSIGLPVSAAETLASGGTTNYTWSLTADGVLSIDADYGTVGECTYLGGAKWYPYRDSITSVVITGHATEIGYAAFFDLPKLKTVSLNTNLGTIGKYAFYGCTALKSFFLSPFLTSPIIEEDAFSGCTALKTLSIHPETEIGAGAFWGCTALSEIYIAGQINNSYTLNPEFATSAFAYVTATVYYPRGMKVYNQSNYGGSLTWKCVDYGICGENVYWHYNETVQTLTLSGEGEPARYWSGGDTPWGAFVRTDIKKIIVRPGITALPAYLFEYAKVVEEISLPEGLESLACNAFNDCYLLNHLLIPTTVKRFEKDTSFNRCTALTDLYYVGTKAEWERVENAKANLASVNNGATITVHVLQWNPATATCGEAGYEGYYSFDSCIYDELYYDENKTLISAPKPMAPTGKHKIRWNEAVQADCHTQGFAEHWECSICECWFSDEAGTAKLEADYTEIDHNNHTGGTEIRNAVAVTPDADGYTGDTYCLGCGELLVMGAVIYRIQVHGDTAVMIGSGGVTQRVSFTTDKEAWYLICDLRYPEGLMLQEVTPVDFKYVSYEKPCTVDGYTKVSIICQYADYDTVPVNTELTPFQAVFAVSPEAEPGEITVEILDSTVLIGKREYFFDNSFDSEITLLPNTGNCATVDSLTTDTGAWNQAFSANVREYTVYVSEATESIQLTAGFSTGGALTVDGVLAVNGHAKEIFLTESKIVITLVRSGVENALDGVYAVTVVKLPDTVTEISEDQKNFTVSLGDTDAEITVLLALYLGDRLTDIQTVTATERTVSFTTQAEWDSMKVMRWSDLQRLQPVGNPEKISIEAIN